MNEQLKYQAPLLISRNLVIFPGQKDQIEVGREYSINAIKQAVSLHQSQIVVVCQQNANIDHPQTQDLYQIGTLCHITNVSENSDGSLVMEVNGLERVLLQQALMPSPNHNLWMVEYSILSNKNTTLAKNRKSIEAMHQLLGEWNADQLEVLEPVTTLLAQKPWKPVLIVDTFANLWPVADENIVSVKQGWLEELDVQKRAKLILASNSLSEDDKKAIDERINRKVNQKISKQQREYFLRERIKVIKEELGENYAKDTEIQEMKDRIEKEPFPESVKQKLLGEISKLEMMPSFSNEFMLTKNYLDWLFALPWWETSKDEANFAKVEKVLNKNHYGLEKVKERILEFLAVQKRKKSQHGSIICLVGPPGVGKTSLAISIAEAMKKPFVKISLGGVSDEAEIRGHRKTYIGSMPGRIIKGLKTAKVKNPLFLLDEIDKLKADHRGDPASALLEVLDPSQNKRFSDNYIEEEFDLSQVMFIATANYEAAIPHALYDRMEIINLTSYTEKEKLAIAKSHLVNEVLVENGISSHDLGFSDEAISHIINRYTREAGVRDLRRKLATICRKFVRWQESGTPATKPAKNSKYLKYIEVNDVAEYLQKPVYDFNIKDDHNLPGVVNGMAYTEYGGDLLPIEVNYYQGSGKVSITGNLKQTMNESVNVALAYVKANAENFGVSHIPFNQIDISVHVPSGGVPKDGPSAGIAITTALISSFRNEAISSNIAMTGEITLRGKVLIIGGVKEKIISAVRGGVKTIFLPQEDERYLVDVPQEVLEKTTIHLVKNYTEVFEKVFSLHHVPILANNFQPDKWKN